MAQAQPQSPEQSTAQLSELRDIHLPLPIEVGLPAPGWWLVALLLLMGLVSGLVWLVNRWRAGRYRRQARAELADLLVSWQTHHDHQAYLQALQQLLKRVALTCFPRDRVASLTGEAWVAFLDRSSGGSDFSMGAGEILIDGGYKPAVAIDPGLLGLHQAALRWLNRHHPKHLDRSEDSSLAGHGRAA